MRVPGALAVAAHLQFHRVVAPDRARLHQTVGGQLLGLDELQVCAAQRPGGQPAQAVTIVQHLDHGLLEPRQTLGLRREAGIATLQRVAGQVLQDREHFFGTLRVRDEAFERPRGEHGTAAAGAGGGGGGGGGGGSSCNHRGVRRLINNGVDNTFIDTHVNRVSMEKTANGCRAHVTGP